MKIDSKIQNTKVENTSKTNNSQDNTTKKFSEEMSDLKLKNKENIENKEIKKAEETEKTEKIEKSETLKVDKVSEKLEKKSDKVENSKDNLKQKDILVDSNSYVKINRKDDSINIDNIEKVNQGLFGIVSEMNNLNQTDEKDVAEVKNESLLADKGCNKDNNEENGLINNDMNIQEPKDTVLLQMDGGMNMNFNSNGQPFADFMNNKDNENLSSNAKDLAEEKKILSSMEENIAMVNRNTLIKTNEKDNNDEQKEVKTVHTDKGIKKVDAKTDIKVDTIVKYDSVIMDKSDVEFFTQLVEKGQVDVKYSEKNVKVSKALSDLIAKAMNDNKPVRIDFDNNISVIIKISRDGKITADFLPSSQVAEAYLKENLPLLKQRFDEQNIDYDELNQREQKQDERNNKKKGRKDE